MSGPYRDPPPLVPFTGWQVDYYSRGSCGLVKIESRTYDHIESAMEYARYLLNTGYDIYIRQVKR